MPKKQISKKKMSKEWYTTKISKSLNCLIGITNSSNLVIFKFPNFNIDRQFRQLEKRG